MKLYIGCAGLGSTWFSLWKVEKKSRKFKRFIIVDAPKKNIKIVMNLCALIHALVELEDANCDIKVYTNSIATINYLKHRTQGDLTCTILREVITPLTREFKGRNVELAYLPKKRNLAYE